MEAYGTAMYVCYRALYHWALLIQDDTYHKIIDTQYVS